MQRVILLTDNEYNELKSQSPSSILQATADNYKKQNEALTRQVYDLQAELNTYKLASAVKEPSIINRGYTYKDYVREYNFMSTRDKGFKTTLQELGDYLYKTPLSIKEVLKQAVHAKLIKRDTKTNKYIVL